MKNDIQYLLLLLLVLLIYIPYIIFLYDGKK